MEVENMTERNNFFQFGEFIVCDLNAMFSRVRALLSSECNIDVWDVFSYELSPVSTSMFIKKAMWICTAKSTLKILLQIEVSRRNQALLTTLSPMSQLFLDNPLSPWWRNWRFCGIFYKRCIASYLTKSDVYLIFDIYYEYSIKSLTGNAQNTGESRKCLQL